MDLVLKYDAEHLRAVKLESEIRGLKSDIEKLEATALVDQATIDKLIIEKASNKPGKKPVNADLNPHSYDGNDNNKVSVWRKRAQAALGIVPKGNGKLSSDNERVQVYQWLSNNSEVRLWKQL